MGPAGSGKSSLAVQYAVAAAERGEKAAIFIFDESVNTLYTRCEGLGVDISSHVESGMIQIQQVDPAELSPGEFVDTVRRVVENDDVKLVVEVAGIECEGELAGRQGRELAWSEIVSHGASYSFAGTQ